jgi:hypothetical protein
MGFFLGLITGLMGLVFWQSAVIVVSATIISLFVREFVEPWWERVNERTKISS